MQSSLTKRIGKIEVRKLLKEKTTSFLKNYKESQIKKDSIEVQNFMNYLKASRLKKQGSF